MVEGLDPKVNGMPRPWKIAAINFDHFHMGDNLRMAMEHPQVEVVGICDQHPARMREAIKLWDFNKSQVFSDYRRCLETTGPDLVLLCPATAEHAVWTERVAEYGVHVLIEKPFADSLASADRMISAMGTSGKLLAINWPLAWYPSHRTAHRIVEDGRLGEIREVHYYDGNRGPLWHGAGKREKTATEVAREKPTSWFYQRASGGGSLLDYLGYGTTLGTWFHHGRIPREVTTSVNIPEGLEVDEHSVTVARYAAGLSTFQTRWGTFSDPWTQQPLPRCGFELVGSEGTLSSYDFEPHVRLQTRANPQGETIPVDSLQPPCQNPVQYVLDCLEKNEPLRGPLSPEVSRIGQQIVDAAMRSAETRRTIEIE